MPLVGKPRIAVAEPIPTITPVWRGTMISTGADGVNGALQVRIQDRLDPVPVPFRE